VARPLPRGSGDTRRAALRPSAPAPVLVSPTCVGLPNRDADSNASPPRLAPRCIVRIDAHGSKDRAKDASPVRMRRSLVPAPGAYALWRTRDGVPLLGVLRTSAVIGAAPVAGGYPRQKPDRPRPPFRRHPAKSTAIQETRMPFTVTPREGVCRGGMAPSGLRAGSLAHAAHTSPPAGPCFLIGHCKVTVRSPADP
jgi:hypothetical protein